MMYSDWYPLLGCYCSHNVSASVFSGLLQVSTVIKSYTVFLWEKQTNYISRT